MWNEYTRVKLLELEAERARLRPAHDLSALRDPRRPFAPVARAAGRRLRSAGEALEKWAARPSMHREPL